MFLLLLSCTLYEARFITCVTVELSNTKHRTAAYTSVTKLEKKTSKPATVLLNNSCIFYDRLISPFSSVQTFRVDIFGLCWKYCRQSVNCNVIEFDILTRKCSIVEKYEYVYSNERYSNIALAELECLDCLGDWDRLVKDGKSGILIRHALQKKCLAVIDANHTGRLGQSDNDTYNFKLSWEKCSEADLWVLSSTESDYTSREKIFIAVYISLINTDWKLDWKKETDGLAFVFLAKPAEITHKGMILEKNTRSSHNDCLFRLSGYKNDLTERTLYLEPNPDRKELLIGLNMATISFLAPLTDKSCPLEQFSVKKGELVNVDQVPYFLSGATVTLRCKPGFGVKEFNYTSYQELKCAEDVRPKPCSALPLTQDQDSTVCYVNLLIVGILTCIIILQLVVLGCIISRSFKKTTEEQIHLQELP